MLAAFHAGGAPINVTLAGGDTYTDNIALAGDSRDLDIMVKIRFNEGENQLVVTVMSYRQLFVLEADARYKQVVGHNKIDATKLPYVVTEDPLPEIRLSKPFRRLLTKPEKKHLFHKWYTVDGLQAAERPYQFVNEFIEETFDIKPQRDKVSFTLRDICVMDRMPDKKQRKRYELQTILDVDRRYDITLQRDPCLEAATELEIASNSLANIRGAMAVFLKAYGNGEVADTESQNAFKEVQSSILGQFPPITVESPCGHVQERYDQYNACRDSISTMNVLIKSAGNEGVSAGAVGEEKGISAATLYAKARHIDKIVNQWKNSADPVERRDLVKLYKDIVAGVDQLIRRKGISSPQQKQAAAVYDKAKSYFEATVK